MATDPDTDLTIPSVLAQLPGDESEARLVLTVIFHPDPARIGSRALLSVDESPCILGRRSPLFFRVQGDQLALEQRDVSRGALSLSQDGDQLELRRLPGSSRCRVGGRELGDRVSLSSARLRAGIPLLLGHSVVLLLRLGSWAAPAPAAQSLDELQGSGASMTALRDQILRLAGTDLDVLVRGETGTGKELVATAIHHLSRRAAGPLVSVNMSAIPPGLAAAALFGSARGAFTGASRSTEGFFNQARGGSLFLDEIGDTPAEVQPQLLRALQQREIQAVGGAVHKVDVRVISATDAALDGEGCDFKAALRHRLGAEISMPPLREHPEDIGELLHYFLSQHCRQANVTGLLPGPDTPAPEIAAWAELFHAFLGYDWPGNVRQLANFVTQVAVASGGGLSVPAHIRQSLAERRDPADLPQAAPETRRRIRDVPEAEFDRVLAAGEYEVAYAARQLGVSRQAVYRRMADSPRHRLANEVPLDEVEQALAAHAGNAGAAALDLKVSPSGLRSRLRDSGLEWY